MGKQPDTGLTPRGKLLGSYLISKSIILRQGWEWAIYLHFIIYTQDSGKITDGHLRVPSVEFEPEAFGFADWGWNSVDTIEKGQQKILKSDNRIGVGKGLWATLQVSNTLGYRWQSDNWSRTRAGMYSG
jgi:hypothetical protein